MAELGNPPKTNSLIQQEVYKTNSRLYRQVQETINPILSVFGAVGESKRSIPAESSEALD